MVGEAGGGADEVGEGAVEKGQGGGVEGEGEAEAEVVGQSVGDDIEDCFDGGAWFE